MRTLSGKRVALLEGRQSVELAAMVSRLGGIPFSAPSVREVPSGADSAPLVARLAAGEFQVAIVLTGAGVTALFKEAERHGRLDDVRARLQQMTIVSRGPKPLTALKRHGLAAQIVTAKPHTTADLVDALAAIDLAGVPVVLLHYGERNPAVTDALVSRGARVEDVCLYEWALPDDLAPLRAVVGDAIGGRLDAMLFTSQIQFRHLLQIAGEMGMAESLRDALNEHVIVAAVGPVCAGALREGGVIPDVLPASPNSASLVNAVGDYFDLMTRSERSAEDS